MGAEVADDIRRAGAVRVDAPAGGGEEQVVAEIPPVGERELAELAGGDVDTHLLDERIAAGVVAGRVHEPPLGCGLEHRAALRRRDRQRLLADDVDPALDCRERLRRVGGVRGADVEDVDVLALEQRLEVVVRQSPRRSPPRPRVRPATATTSTPIARSAIACTRAMNPEPAIAARISAGREEHLVSTSMSRRALSGGVRQGVPSTMQSWK